MSQVRIASGGVAALNIHYSAAYATKAALKSDPGKTIVASAKALAEKLGAITGAAFQVTPLEPNASISSGIVLGVVPDFEAWRSQAAWFVDGDPTKAERYEICLHEGGIHIAGATALAVQHAVWDLLYRVGYRQYFPSPAWEIVPSIPELGVDIDVYEQPDFLDRYYWGGHGQWEETEDRVADWRAKNRMARGFRVNAGNGGYESIISKNREALQSNPDHFALVNGVRQTSGTKFCTANPGLRQIVVNDVFRRFSNQLVTSQSLEASDLPDGYCECEVTLHGGIEYPGCNKLFGNIAENGRSAITNRVVSLANAAAAAIRELYPERQFLIGMLAYSTHCESPTIRVDKNVSIGFATDYNGGRNTTELMLAWMRQWQDMGSENGAIHDYWSNSDQHWDLPGVGGASHSDFWERTIVPYYNSGIQFLTAEANYNWGPNGLGYWLASRILWDTSEAVRVRELCEDFLTKCFGPSLDCIAAAKAFYDLIDGKNNPVLSTHLLGNMYARLQDALRATTDVAVRRRLYDLVLYTRWVELKRHHISVKGDAVEFARAWEALMRWGYRIRWTEMTHSCALWRGESDKIPVETSGVPAWQDKTHSWKSDPPLGRDGYSPEDVFEIAGPNGDGRGDSDSILARGILNNPLTTSWSPKVFPPTDLIPVPENMWTPHKFYNVWGSYSYITSEHSFYVWIDAPGAVSLSVMSGLVSPRPATLVTVELVDHETNVVVSSGQAPNDATKHNVTLQAVRPGLHRLVVKPGHRVRAVLDWPKGLRVTLNYGTEKELGQYRFLYRITQYVYVPKGTSVIGVWFDNGGNKFESPLGVHHTFSGNAGNYASIVVPPGADGTFWRFNNNPCARIVLNIPAYFARHPSEMLLPREVIDQHFQE